MAEDVTLSGQELTSISSYIYSLGSLSRDDTYTDTHSAVHKKRGQLKNWLLSWLKNNVITFILEPR